VCVCVYGCIIANTCAEYTNIYMQIVQQRATRTHTYTHTNLHMIDIEPVLVRHPIAHIGAIVGKFRQLAPCTHIHTHTHTHTHTQRRVHKYTHAHTHTHQRVDIETVLLQHCIAHTAEVGTCRQLAPNTHTKTQKKKT